MRVRWLRPAVETLNRVFERIAAENPTAAKRVFRRIVGATRRLEEFPLSCPAGELEGTHNLVVTGLPYLIVYRVRGEQVEVLRVFHTSQERSELLN